MRWLLLSQQTVNLLKNSETHSIQCEVTTSTWQYTWQLWQYTWLRDNILFSATWRLPRVCTPASQWTWCSRGSSATTCSPSTSRPSWRSACPGCPSGWTTSPPRPGWRSPSPRCSPCPPPPPPSTAPCPPLPTPRWDMRPIQLTTLHPRGKCALSGDRRVEQHLCLICIPRPPGVRPCQLRSQGRRQVMRRALFIKSKWCWTILQTQHVHFTYSVYHKNYVTWIQL